ncbi:phage portal protein [Rhodopseudomonas palustris]|uniref:phage portal protein n=1 Tax=Rhodopseudomonas palustris TaxID=1076 RepID=UPI000D199FCD|nr:phage portal protein [Rhodopseudomonas palustris]AVT83673.1 hypothetical protein RPYSC3_48130 [Rhodopseudomonas palustris]
MPEFLSRIPFLKKTDNPHQTGEIQVHRLEGIDEHGRVVLRDSRGTRKAEVPTAEEKSVPMGNDPLAIYRPTASKRVDAAKAMGSFSGWTFAAVNAIGMSAIDVEWRMFKKSGGTPVEIEEHEVLDLLDQPNDDTIGKEFVYTMLAHLELTGNCYVLLDGVKDDMTPPRALYLLNPGRITVKINKNVFPHRISHYELTSDGNIYTFQPYQILHIKYVDPNNPFEGIGVPQTIPTWIDSDNHAMEYNRKFFENGASIGLYISTDTNVEGNIDRIRKGFKDRYAGKENAHKVPVMPKGTKLEHTGVTHKDMDFSTLTDQTRDRILAGFRVSKTILGTAESDTNRSTAETADYVFSKRTMKPKLMLIVSFLNARLVPRFGDGLFLTFVDPVPEDREIKMKEMTAATGGVPLMTQNEAREAYLDLEEIEGGDKLYIPNNMTAAGDRMKPETDVPEKIAKRMTATGQMTSAIRIRTGNRKTWGFAKHVFKNLSSAFKSIIDTRPEYQFKKLNDLTDDEYMEHYKRFSFRSEMAVQQLDNVFKGINKKQKEDVIANLPDATGVTKAVGELFDLKEWMGITIDLATPILLSLTRDEATAALAMVGANHQDILADESTRNALDRSIARMARSYNETTLEQLKAVLTEKLDQEGGTNLRELTDAVEGVYDFADSRRAGLIAKTESYRTANWANREAWEKSGVVQSLKWYTAEDAKVCPDCAGMNGKTVGISQKFFDDNYADGMTPPLHPDCRCYIRPETISI